MTRKFVTRRVFVGFLFFSMLRVNHTFVVITSFHDNTTHNTHTQVSNLRVVEGIPTHSVMMQMKSFTFIVKC